MDHIRVFLHCTNYHVIEVAFLSIMQMEGVNFVGRGLHLLKCTLSDVWLECESCLGARYNQSTLEVEFQNKNIAEVLDMTVDELRFFSTSTKIYKDYLLYKIGLRIHSTGTTSQPIFRWRHKESDYKELAKAPEIITVLLDEPTTGLHFDDVKW